MKTEDLAEPTIDEITKQRIIDLVISLSNLDKIAFVDETFLGSGYYPFKLRGMIDFQYKTLLLNQAIRKACNFKD